MSLKTLEIKWKPVLFSILEELTEAQYRKLLFNLDRIPQGVKGGKVREEIPQIIIQYFGAEESISVIDKEMKQIPRMDAAVQGLLRPFVDKLKKQRQKNKGTTSKRAADSGSVAKREKTAAGTTSKRAADSGSVAKREKTAADQQKSCRPDKERNSRPWRKYICDLNSSGQLLDTDGIIGKVVQKSGLRTYQTQDKVRKGFFYLAVADETSSVKLMVYGKERHQEIKEESFYFFSKLMIDDKGVKVTTLSIVSETSPVEVPEELEMEARKLICSQSPVFSIAEAKSSADRTEVSVEGTVTEIDPVQRVTVKHKLEKTKRQHFQLEDETDSIEIFMWGEDTKQCKGLSVGDVIEVTNMKTSQYYGDISLNSTRFTRIHMLSQ